MNWEFSVGDLIAIVSAFVVAIKVFLPQFWPTKVEKADISLRHVNIAKEYQTMLEEEVMERKKLEVEMDELKKELKEYKGLVEIQTERINELRKGITKLITQLKTLDIQPVWEPPSDI